MNLSAWRKQEGLSKMMALSVFLHLAFFAFLTAYHLFLTFRTPNIQGFQVDLISGGPGGGLGGGSGGGPGGGSSAGSGGSTTSLPRSTSAKTNTLAAESTGSNSANAKALPPSNGKTMAPPPEASVDTQFSRPIKTPVSPPARQDDPERLEEWWKKQKRALKPPEANPEEKKKPVPQEGTRTRTAKIDIDRKTVVIPPTSQERPAPPKVQAPDRVQSPLSGTPSGTGPQDANIGASSNQDPSRQEGSAPASPGNGNTVTSSVGGPGGSPFGGSGNGGSGAGGSGFGGTGNGGSGFGGSGIGAGSLSSFKFPGYLQKIDNKIRWQWAPPPVRSKTSSLVIRFNIGKDGGIDKRSVIIQESSGNAFFDQAALRAIFAAHPLPPLPEAYTEDLLTVYMNFVVKEDS